MNEIEKICKEILCQHFIVWNFGYGDCISCKLQGESYNIESVADDCPYVTTQHPMGISNRLTVVLQQELH